MPAASPDSFLLRLAARQHADRLTAAGADCVLLYGSAAAGTAGPESDADMIAVFTTRPDRATMRTLRHIHGVRSDINLTTWKQFAHDGPSHWAYLQHVRRCMTILAWHDRLEAVLTRPGPSGPAAADDLARWARRTTGQYADPAWMGHTFLYGLADLYRAGRSAAMLANALHDDFTPGRAQAISRFARRTDVQDAAAQLNLIEPVWKLTLDRDVSCAPRQVCPDTQTFRCFYDTTQTILAAADRDLRSV